MITVILGMHRSGTSALAGLLHSNGIVMGRDEDFYPPPMKENPKGFYENVRFRRINDQILKEVNYKVKSFDPNIPVSIPPTENEKLRKMMKELIRSYDKEFSNWGWKDPRTSLTFASWCEVMDEMEVLTDVRVIVILRPATQVAKSMMARGNKEKYRGQFSKLSIEYMARAVQAITERSFIPSTAFQFEALLYQMPTTINTLEELLGVKIPDTSFVDPSIVRTVP